MQSTTVLGRIWPFLSVALGAALIATALVGPATAQSSVRFRATVTNETDPEMVITPGAFLVHSAQNVWWLSGAEADLALERIAEIGVPDEAVSALGATALGPIVANGDSITFEFDAVPGYFLTFAQMLMSTNDAFVGVSGLELFSGGSPVETTLDLFAYDAGTEENADLFAGFDAGQPDPPQGEANIDNGVATAEPITLSDQFDGPQGTLSIAPLIALPAAGSGGLAGSGGPAAWVIALIALGGVLTLAGVARVAVRVR